MATVESLIVTLDAKIDGYVADMKKADNVTVKSTNKMKEGFKGAASSVGALSTAMVGAAASAAVMITVMANNAKEIRNNANVAGVSVERFQELAHAYSTVGLEADKFADISKDVTDRVGDFLQTGGGPLADFFENVAPQIGLTAKELQELSGNDALQAVKNAMDEVNLSAEEQVFHFEAIAGDASLLIPLMANNAEQMKKLAKNYREFNTVLSETDIDDMTQLSNLINEISDSFTNDLTKSVSFFSQEIAHMVIDVNALISKLGENIVDSFADSFREVNKFYLAFKTAWNEITGDYEEARKAFEEYESAVTNDADFDTFHDEQIQRINEEREARKAAFDENLEDIRRRRDAEKEAAAAKLEEGATAAAAEEENYGFGVSDDPFDDGGASREQRAAMVKDEENQAKATENKYKSKVKSQKDYVKASAALNAAFFNDNKAIGAGIIVADTAIGIAEGVKLGWPAAIPAVAYAVATGTMALSQLNSASSGGGGSISGGGGAPASSSGQLFEDEGNLFLSSSGTSDEGGTAGGGMLRFAVDSGDDILDAIAGALNKGQLNGKFS